MFNRLHLRPFTPPPESLPLSLNPKPRSSGDGGVTDGNGNTLPTEGIPRAAAAMGWSGDDTTQLIKETTMRRRKGRSIKSSARHPPPSPPQQQWGRCLECISGGRPGRFLCGQPLFSVGMRPVAAPLRRARANRSWYRMGVMERGQRSLTCLCWTAASPDNTCDGEDKKNRM